MTDSAIIVSSIQSITADFITCNSGTFSGEFSANNILANSALFPINVTAGSINTNSAAIAGALTADSLAVNSAAITGGLVTGSIDSNSGSFAVSLQVNNEDVLTASALNPERYYLATNPMTIVNMPSELNFLGDSAIFVQKVDLTGKNEVRFMTTQLTAGASNARMRINYSSSFGTFATDYSNVLSTSGINGGVELDISSGNDVHDSGWLPLEDAAKNIIYLGVVVSGGNGSADPEFGSVVVEFK